MTQEHTPQELVAALRAFRTRLDHLPDVRHPSVVWVVAHSSVRPVNGTVVVIFECARCSDRTERRYCCSEVAKKSLDEYAKLHVRC